MLCRSVFLDRLETPQQALAPDDEFERIRLAEHSPQLPQGFTPIANLTFWPGKARH